MINIIDKEKCTGCSTCYSVCPTNAISFVADNEGFEYPKVNLDKCINCNLCEQNCPLIIQKQNLNNAKPKIYAAWNKDEIIRVNSTSGGIFSLLAEEIYKSNGIVVGAVYEKDFTIKHIITDNIETLSSLRQSKYAQSSIKGIFPLIKKHLEKKTIVLFCGTPCQVAGLKMYLNKVYANLVCVDFICRGVTSPMVYQKYLESISKTLDDEIKSVQFKNKDYGWNRFSTKVYSRNGKVYQKDRYEDSYMKGYLKYNLFIRPSCHSCKFKKMPREGDITLGDFWGIGTVKEYLDDNKGTSVIMTNSDKGNDLLNQISEKMFFEESELDKVIEGNGCLFDSIEYGKYRGYFFNNINKVSFDKIIDKIDKFSQKKTIKMIAFQYLIKCKIIIKRVLKIIGGIV